MIKLMGAALIVIAASSVGIRMARAVRVEERTLSQVSRVIELMSCEILCRLTPTVQLCEMAAAQCTGALAEVFFSFARRLELQDAGNSEHIMEAVLVRHGGSLPPSCVCRMRELGGILGAYEAQEQVNALNALRGRVNLSIEELREGKAQRCRSYEVMGVCAGSALAIILL